MFGPEAITREDRRTLVNDIVVRAQQHRGRDVLAIGVYGSLARGEDGPFSDVEVLCVLRTIGEDKTHEWTTGPWKAELNLRSRDVVLAEAARIDGDWSLTQSALARIRPAYDPEDFFVQLRETVYTHSQAQLDLAMRDLIIGELYERMGKLRNARDAGWTALLPELAVAMARHGAFLIGLANAHLYATSGRLFEEALTLPNRPDGFDALCELAMSGNLGDPPAIHTVCETYWSGVIAWCNSRGLEIVSKERIPF